MRSTLTVADLAAIMLLVVAGVAASLWVYHDLSGGGRPVQPNRVVVELPSGPPATAPSWSRA